MPDVLKSNDPEAASITWQDLLWRLGLAYLFGYVVAVIYRKTRQHGTVAPTFPPTLVLLSILIAMVTQVIGDNIARAFSLVGALSIVRFRTVVQDTQDTAFVIFAVVVGMAVGAGPDHLWVASMGLAVVGTAAILMKQGRPAMGWIHPQCTLELRVGIGQDPEAILTGTVSNYLEHYEVLSIVTAKQGDAIDYEFKVRLRPETVASDLVKKLNQVEGVQNVELHRIEE